MENNQNPAGKGVQTLLRLELLKLENYRNFKSVEISFDPKMTVVVARNGCGKTAILDAIAVALGPFIGAFGVAKGVHFRQSDVQIVRKPSISFVEMEPKYPLLLSAGGFINNERREWRRKLSTKKSRTTHGEAKALIDFGVSLQKSVQESNTEKSDNLVLPLVSYYGTGRLWSEKKLTAGKKAAKVTSRLAGYTDCLESTSRYKMFADWFEQLCRSEFDERDNPNKLENIRIRLRILQDAVNKVLEPSSWRNITYKSSEAGIVAEHEQYGQLNVDWLSDGIRNLIALTADIAHRAIRLNSHLGKDAVLKTPGIVLIDEVDMHLHPEWQQNILNSLSEAFPMIQFIVTTHSPLVLTTIPKENIRLMTMEGSVEVFSNEIGTYGAESSRVLQEIFGVHARPQNVEIVKKLQDYLVLIEEKKGKTNEAIKIRNELENALGKKDPDLLAADVRIKQLEFLSKNEKDH